MANIPITSVTSAGATFTVAGIGQAAAGGGDSLTGVDDRTELVVYNGSGGALTVTVGDPGRTPAGNTGTTVPVSVAATTFALIPVGPANVDPSTGLVSVTYSGVTSLRVAAYRR